MQKTQESEKLQLKIFFGILGVLLLALGVVLVLLLWPSQKTPAPQSAVPAETLPPLDANPYKPEDFAEIDGYLACVTGPCSMGIDVSSYQGDINWQQVKHAGVEFVIIRIGGRGYGQEGNLYADSRAQEYYRGAKAAGLQVGAYFFSQAVSRGEAYQEAQYALELLEGWELDLPVVYDWEYISASARTAKVDARTLTDCAKTFCKAVEDAGRSAMVYFNPNQAKYRMYLEELTEYPFWLAMYDAPMSFPYEVEFWQYTDTGRIPGIYGNVDINLMLPKKPIA